MSVGIIRNVIKSSDLPTSIHTFADVQKVLNAGKEIEMLTVGMEMDEVTVGSEPMVWIIGNISNGEVIFVPKWCLATTRQMNSTNTNVGGWNSSALRTWLNGDFYNSLPSSVKPYIKDRTFQTSQGNKSTALQSATDKIWLPREYEVFGVTTYAAATEHTDGGAEQFSIFGTQGNRIKTQGKTGSACIWSLSSPKIATVSAFEIVNETGSVDDRYGGASNAYGIAPCFRMTPDGGVELVDINPNKTSDVYLYLDLSRNRSNEKTYFPVQGYKQASFNFETTYGTVKYAFIYDDETVSAEVTVTNNVWIDISIPTNALFIRFNVSYSGSTTDAGMQVFYSLFV